MVVFHGQGWPEGNSEVVLEVPSPPHHELELALGLAWIEV
jgi:hypothetical protein